MQLIRRLLSKTKSVGRESRSRESGRQADSQTTKVDGLWSWGGGGREKEDESG